MPPKAKRTPFSISLPPDLAAQLTHEAETRMLNPSLLVERAIAAYLPTLPKLEPPTT